MSIVRPEENLLYQDGSRIPPHYFEELLALDPEAVCRRGLVSHKKDQGFRVPFLSRSYWVDPEQRRIVREDTPEKNLSFQEYLVLLVYLIRAQDLPLTEKKITEREIPGGEWFFRGPHALFREPLERRFGRDPQGFLLTGLTLEGRPTSKGDASFELFVLPRIPVEYILYREDEEFPAQIVITFDSSIHYHLPLDVIWSLINLTGWRILRFGQESR